MGWFEMLGTAEFLRELYIDHADYVVYPPGKGSYTGEEFIACMCADFAFYRAVDSGCEILALEPLMLMMERELQRHGVEDSITIEVGHLRLDMNKMNLENLQGEMRALKFDGQLIEQMEREMAKGQPGFQLFAQLPADKGQLDVTLNFKRSGSSEYYFLNRYDLALSKAKPLEEGKSYMVISPDPEKEGKKLVKKFDSATKAIDYFKSQKHSSELAMGKSAADKMTLATMDKGKVDYVNKEFRTAYYTPVITNSQFVDRGRGFNVVQAANMLQGRAAYRDDLVSRTGEMYKAWNVFEFNEARDRYGNHRIRQYSEGYGFDVQKELNRYNIKELADGKKENVLLEKLKDGNSPVVTVVGQDGREHKLRIEAMPRYTNFNFYQLNGRIEKREQFLKEPEKGQQKANSFEKKLNQRKDQSQGMAI